MSSSTALLQHTVEAGQAGRGQSAKTIAETFSKRGKHEKEERCNGCYGGDRRRKEQTKYENK